LILVDGVLFKLVYRACSVAMKPWRRVESRPKEDVAVELVTIDETEEEMCLCSVAGVEPWFGGRGNAFRDAFGVVAWSVPSL
jgi:hypothetical protein